MRNPCAQRVYLFLRSLQSIAALSTCLAISSAKAAEPLVIEGSRELLDSLRAAQASNVALYPRGEMTCVVHSRVGENEKSLITRLETTLVWDDQRTYCKYLSKSGGSLNEESVMSGESGELIDDRSQDSQIYFTARGGIERRLRCRTNGTVLIDDLRPESWFRLMRWSFDDWLNPEKGVEEGAVAVTISQEGDLVTVRWRHADGEMVKLVCSLADDGNVVEYDLASGVWGSFEWDRTTTGRVYPRRSEFYISPANDREHPFESKIVEISSFSESIGFAGDRFAEASFGAAEDVPVTSYVDGKLVNTTHPRLRPRVGVDQNDLERLIESLQGSGFAEPTRDE